MIIFQLDDEKNNSYRKNDKKSRNFNFIKNS